MAASPYNKFNCFLADVTNKVHNLGGDVLKVCLTNVAPVATNTVYANITDLTTQGGYTAGGTQSTTVSNTQTTGTDTFILNPVTFTCNGVANIGPFRYAVLYNSTPGSGNLIAWYDYGSSTTLVNTGDTFTVNFSLVTGVFTLA